MGSKKKIYVALDTETTGLLKPDSAELQLQPYMTELCLIKFNSKFEILEKYESLYNIPMPVPELITKITGITDEMLENQPSFFSETRS